MPGGFWQHIVDSSMALPTDRPLGDLTAELVTMLGSSDPVDRDIAATVLARWIRDGVYDDLLLSVGDSIVRGLETGLGRTDDETVFRRSFSALVLARCVARDNAAILIPVDAVLDWADRSLHWYVAERDLRGLVPG
ncbi:MAG: DUF2785 domain-containing protein, partial [Propionibacteriales bacterium]|nr:DUF2785 domain-containing protein [Propionibacteriales bacterium]